MKKKQQKVIILNERGKVVKKCPHCKSSRLRRAEGKGFYCDKCRYLNKRRFTSDPKEVGKVSFRTY